MKKNSFVTFSLGRNNDYYGIVANLQIKGEYANIVYHNGMKITTIHKKVTTCKEITNAEFLELIDKHGDTSWYSQADSIKTFHDVTFLPEPILKPNPIKYKDGEKVFLKGTAFEYNDYYKRLEVIRDEDDDQRKPSKIEVICPCCHGACFTISYGNYECIAHCPCGHDMVVYDG